MARRRGGHRLELHRAATSRAPARTNPGGAGCCRSSSSRPVPGPGPPTSRRPSGSPTSSSRASSSSAAAAGRPRPTSPRCGRRSGRRRIGPGRPSAIGPIVIDTASGSRAWRRPTGRSPHEVLHGHDVLRRPELRRGCRLCRAALRGPGPQGARGPRRPLRRRLRGRPRPAPAPALRAAAGRDRPPPGEPLRRPLAAGDADHRPAPLQGRGAPRPARRPVDRRRPLPQHLADRRAGRPGARQAGDPADDRPRALADLPDAPALEVRPEAVRHAPNASAAAWPARRPPQAWRYTGADRPVAPRARRPGLPEPPRAGGAPAPGDRGADGPPAVLPARRLVGRDRGPRRRARADRPALRRRRRPAGRR